MRSQSPPPAPDPAKQIEAQTAANRDTAVAQTQLNMVDQDTPYGSLTYEQTGTYDDGTPKFRATTGLTPEQQGLLDQQNEFGGIVNAIGIDQAKMLGGHLGNPVDLSTASIDDAILERYMPRFNEYEQEARDRLETMLVNKGIRVGDAAYADAVRDHDRNFGDKHNQLMIDARGKTVQEILAERNQPINEITALLSGGQVTAPNFTSTPQTGIEGVNVAGINQQGYQNQLNRFKYEQDQKNAMMGGIAGLGSAALQSGWMMSDERVKEDVKKIGKLDSGLPVYSFKYKGSPLQEMGVMAQDVEKVQPEAVAMTDSGYKAVDYGAVADAAAA